MIEKATSNTMLAKIIRILLVFTLVFWASFKVETLALAADDDGDATVDEVQEVLDDGEAPADNDTPTDNDTPAEDEIPENTLVDMLVYKVNGAIDSENIDGDTSDDFLGSASDPAPGGKLALLEMEVGDTATFVAELQRIDNSSSIATKAVSWNIDGECVQLDKDTNGMLMVKAVSEGTAFITCSLGASAENPVSSSFPDGKLEVEFEVEVAAPEPVVVPEISKISIVGPDGQVLQTEQALELSEQERGNYAFGAIVEVLDSLTGDPIGTYSTMDGSLSEQSHGILSDPQWQLQADDDSSISAELAEIGPDSGVLNMKADGKVNVLCTVSLDEGAKQSSARLAVVSGSSGGSNPVDVDDPIQGKHNPQSTLHITGQQVKQVEANTPNEGDSDKSADAGDDTASDETGENASEPEDGTVNPQAEEDAENKEGNSEGASSGSSAASSTEVVTIDKTFTAEDLRAIGQSTATYSMRGSGGWQIVDGAGPYLEKVLIEAGVDINQIESLTFNGDAGEVTVKWSDLMAERSYFPNAAEDNYDDAVPSSPMIAVDSYVHPAASAGNAGDSNPDAGSEANAGEGAENNETSETNGAGEGAQPKLLDNTRFRILVGATNPPSSDIDPDMLRWVNTITVNAPKGEGPDPDPDPDPNLKVRISYKPAPIGSYAVLSAVPNNYVGSSHFGFRWQSRASESEKWADIGEESTKTQLVIKMTEDIEGHQYRVILETDMLNEKGEYRIAYSDPVTLRASSPDDFSVQITYDPPFAGGIATFQSSITGNVDPAEVTYQWQLSQDGGETWKPIDGETKPQLSFATSPVTGENSSSGSSSGSADAKPGPITYIRVKATAADGREDISNEIPLTVQVSPDGSNEGNSTDPDKNKEGDPSNSPGSPSGPSTPSDNPSAQPHSTEVTVTKPEVPSESPPEEPDTPPTNGGSTQDNSENTQAPEIVVDPDMSEKIIEQVEQARAATEATTPGARWTEISATGDSAEDVRRLLSTNPFAPFAMPLGLGIIVAGGLEKLIAFRRQL